MRNCQSEGRYRTKDEFITAQMIKSIHALSQSKVGVLSFPDIEDAPELQWQEMRPNQKPASKLDRYREQSVRSDEPNVSDRPIPAPGCITDSIDDTRDLFDMSFLQQTANQTV